MSILSETRILEFEFVALSADSIVIAYLRGACSPGQPYPPTLCDAIRRPTRGHACMHVFSRVSVTRNHPASRFGTFIAGRESYTRLSFVFSRVRSLWSLVARDDDHHSLTATSSSFSHSSGGAFFQRWLLRIVFTRYLFPPLLPRCRRASPFPSRSFSREFSPDSVVVVVVVAMLMVASGV